METKTVNLNHVRAYTPIVGEEKTEKNKFDVFTARGVRIFLGIQTVYGVGSRVSRGFFSRAHGLRTMETTRRYKPRLTNHDPDNNTNSKAARDLHGDEDRTHAPVARGEVFYSDRDLFFSNEKQRASGAMPPQQQQQQQEEELFGSDRAAFPGQGRGSGFARIEDGQIVHDDIYEDFQRMDAHDIQEQFKPPYAPRLQDSEVQVMLDWEKRRIEQRKRLRTGKLQKFINNVAGFLHMDPARLQGSPTGEGPYRGGGMSPYGQGVIPQNALHTILSPPGPGAPPVNVLGPSAPLDVSSLPVPPPSAPSGLDDPSTKQEDQTNGKPGVRAPPFLAGDTVPSGQEGGRSLTPEELRQIQEHEEAQRLYTAKSWMETAPLMGLQDLSAGLSAHMDMAYTQVVQRVQSMGDVPDAEAFIHTDLVQVQSQFARLTAWLMSETNFFEPTRQTYDANARRIGERIHKILGALEHYSWDSMHGDFKCLDDGDAGMVMKNGCFRRTRTGTRLPRYLLE